MTNQNSYTLRDILRIFFSHKIFFVVIPAVLVIAAYIRYELQTPMYEASVRMFVKGEKKTEAEFYVGIGKLSHVGEHVGLIRSNTVLGRVVEVLKLYDRPVDYEKAYASSLKRAFIDYSLDRSEAQTNLNIRFARAIGELNANMVITPDNESNMLTINVTDFNPAIATKTANSISRSYVIFDLEQQIEELKLKYGEKNPEVLQLKDYMNEFKKTLHGNLIPDIEAFGPASIKIVAQAEGAALKTSIPRNVLLIFSFFTGIFLAIIFSAIFEYTGHTFRTPKKVVEHLNLPLLGSIPKRKLTKKTKDDSQPTDDQKTFQVLTEQLTLLTRDKNLKTILITDVEGSQETPVINANIGLSFAHETGRRTLIIDADLHNSSLSKMFNITDNGLGLADIIESKSSIMHVVHDLGSNLYFIPAGITSANPVVLLDSPEMSELLKRAKEEYDLILINCPDLRNYTDPVILSSYIDGLILVVNEGKVRRQILDNAVNPLKQKGVNIIGIIFNNRTYAIPDFIYRLT